MPDRELVGRTALVTGGGRGMGLAIARALAARGANIVLNDLDEALLDDAVGSLGSDDTDVRGVVGDVTNAGSVGRMLEVAQEGFGAVDILVNNAGVLRPTRFVDISEEEWDHVLDVNLKGTFLCSKAVVPAMQRRGWGRIVNLSSTAGKNVSTMGGAHYTTAKTAILGLTRAVAAEVAGDGVTVNAVCPGLIDTDMTRTTISEDQQAAYARSFPIPRLGRPDEVADVIAFLASDRAAYITGAAVDINGGDLMV